MDLPSLAPHPLRQFEAWLQEAEESSGLAFPNAMNLATAGKDGRPSSRMVLLKGLSERGFLFFTNYESRKARELAENPFAALCFYWEQTHRSVRAEGKVEKISREESQAYFDTRPRESRIGAWASPQSREIASRAELEQKVKEMEKKFAGQEQIPVPDHWGGYCLVPEALEFWINGPNRLHDRFQYKKDEPNNDQSGWKITRLAP